MTETPQKFTAVGLLCWAVPLTLNFAAGLMSAVGADTSLALNLLGYIATGWAFGIWLKRDNRMSELRGVMDLGYLLYVAWALFLPYYLLKTRGVKASFIIVGFVVAYICAAFAGLLVGTLLVV